MEQAKEKKESAATDEAKKDAGQKKARTPRNYRRILRKGLTFVLCAGLCLLLVLGEKTRFQIARYETESGLF